MKRMRMTAWLILALMLVAGIASACPVCYGNSASAPMVKGSNNAILFMLGVIGFVQLGFIALFWTFWRRAQALRRHRQSFRVIEGGSGALARSRRVHG